MSACSFKDVVLNFFNYLIVTLFSKVSGLPIKNGNRHAGEIASMSLKLLEAVQNHKMRHRPNDTLKLRIGIHTGITHIIFNYIILVV